MDQRAAGVLPELRDELMCTRLHTGIRCSSPRQTVGMIERSRGHYKKQNIIPLRQVEWKIGVLRWALKPLSEAEPKQPEPKCQIWKDA
jgi:hypothetical protein